MDDSPQKQLLVNYLLGICTSRERQEVEQWLEEGNSNLLLEVADELRGEKTYAPPKKEEVNRELMRKIFTPLQSVVSRRTHSVNVPFYKRGGFWVKMAALLLVAILSGSIALFLGAPLASDEHVETVFKQTSLSNGQTASLQFGDGTVVQLNGGSELRYPETFAKDQREIFLDGEGFFEVYPDDKRPFIVHAGDTKTRVLGTSFNVKAYSGEGEIQVVVAEGKVAVSRPDKSTDSQNTMPETVFLEKNQWLTYHPFGGIFEQGEGNIRELIAWKDRVLMFSNKSFGQVASMLERWYGVEIRIDTPELRDVLLEGEHLDVSLEEVLVSIQYVMDFEFEINGDYVRIY